MFTTQANIPDEYLDEAKEVLDRYHKKPEEYTHAQWYGGKWIVEHLKALAIANRRDKKIVIARTEETSVPDNFAE